MSDAIDERERAVEALVRMMDLGAPKEIYQQSVRRVFAKHNIVAVDAALLLEHKHAETTWYMRELEQEIGAAVIAQLRMAPKCAHMALGRSRWCAQHNVERHRPGSFCTTDVVCAEPAPNLIVHEWRLVSCKSCLGKRPRS